MRLNKEIVERTSYLQDLRHLIHSNPETAFEEVATSRLIADVLGSAGIEVHCGLAKTGVVGTLRGRGQSSRAIGLRADIDALNITEKTSLEYASRVSGKMHACGQAQPCISQSFATSTALSSLSSSQLKRTRVAVGL